MTATSSLSVSLAAKPNDHFTLIFPTTDSVIFPTGRHKFDINFFRHLFIGSEGVPYKLRMDRIRVHSI